MNYIEELQDEIYSLRRRFAVLEKKVRATPSEIPPEWRIPPRRYRILQALLRHQTVEAEVLAASAGVSVGCIKAHIHHLRKDLDRIAPNRHKIEHCCTGYYLTDKQELLRRAQETSTSASE